MGMCLRPSGNGMEPASQVGASVHPHGVAWAPTEEDLLEEGQQVRQVRDTLLEKECPDESHCMLWGDLGH